MINQKENEKFRVDSWLLKLLPKNMKTKTKNKYQPTIIKDNRRTKAMRNITPNMDNYPRNG